MEQQLQSKVNFYELLGIDRKATYAEVKKAYRTLVKQYHPDVSNKPDTVKTFQLIQTAYEVLSDPTKRPIYDDLLYRKEHGMDYTGFQQYTYQEHRRHRHYQQAAATPPAQETWFDQIRFHLKQIIGVVIVTTISIVAIGLMGLGIVFLFIKDFNGAMVAGYASLAAGIGILLNVIKAYRTIADIWLAWFREE